MDKIISYKCSLFNLQYQSNTKLILKNQIKKQEYVICKQLNKK